MTHIWVDTLDGIYDNYVTSDTLLIDLPDRCTGGRYCYDECDYCKGVSVDCKSRKKVYKVLGFNYIPEHYPDIVIAKSDHNEVRYDDITVKFSDFKNCKKIIKELIDDQRYQSLLDDIRRLYSKINAVDRTLCQIKDAFTR